MSKAPLLVTILSLAVALVACEPADPLVEARALVRAGDIDASLAVLRGLLAERPDDPEVNYLYGSLLAGQGQPALASWSLRKAMEHEDWLVRAGMALAIGSIATQQHDAALEMMDRVLEAEPENIQALLLRGRANFESRRHYPEALADAERVLELDPDSRDALVWKTVSLLHLERTEEAEVLIDQIEQRFAEADAPLQQTLRFCGARAMFAAVKGESELADERYRECLALDPAHRVVTESAVAFYRERGEPQRVLEIYRAAHEVDPVNGGYRAPLATALYGQGEADAAEALLLEGTELEQPGAAVNSWMDLATLYSDREDYSAAASAVKGAMDRLEAAGQPIDPLLAFNYADTLLLADRYAEADAAARSITLPQFRNYIEARVLLENGDPQAALEKFDVVLANWPNNAASRYYAAIASEEAGDFAAAIESYRYAIRAGRGETDARMRLGRLHAAAGDYERANTALAAAAGNAGVEQELQMEGMRLVGRFGSGEEIRQRLAQHKGKPTAVGALVALAEGLHDRAGPEAALGLFDGPDLTRQGAAPALRAVVGYLGELGRHDEALQRVTAALERHPDFGPFHEAHGRALAAAGRAAGAQAAFARAAELAPEDARVLNAQVLEGRGQLAAGAGDADAALAFYARAAQKDPEWAQPDRAAAELLLSLGRNAEAEEHLERVIDRDPYDPWAPSRLAELLLVRGADPARSLALARRAVYCGGGEEARALLARAGGRAPAAAATP